MFKQGEIVEISTSTQQFKGVFIKEEKDFLVIKLGNSYNIGIAKRNIKSKKEVGKVKPEKKDAKTPKQKPDPKLPLISILHTGGTIASKVDYTTGAVYASFKPEDLLEMFPELFRAANFESKLIANMWSDDLRFKHFEMIAKAVEKEVKKGAAGIIIGMGTDNLAVASAALSFIVEQTPVPIIFVGAQRSSDRGSSDAAVNLICAAEFIAKTAFAGVAVCMHESPGDKKCIILPACKTRKLHTSRRDAFKPVNDRIIARVDYENKKIDFVSDDFAKKSKDKKAELVIKPKMEEKVGLLKVHVNMSPEQFEFYKGYKGLVIEGTGLGHTPGQVPNHECAVHKKIYPAIKELVDSGCVVVMTSQCLFGRVNMNVYNKGAELRDLGVVSGEDMLPNTAFVKLAWLLGNYKAEEAKELISKNLRGEISDRRETEEFWLSK